MLTSMQLARIQAKHVPKTHKTEVAGNPAYVHEALHAVAGHLAIDEVGDLHLGSSHPAPTEQLSTGGWRLGWPAAGKQHAMQPGGPAWAQEHVLPMPCKTKSPAKPTCLLRQHHDLHGATGMEGGG